MAEAITASGKTSRQENFPVASFLLPARVRAHVKTLYAYARLMDDIADSPVLAAADKITNLDRFARAVSGANLSEPVVPEARHMRESLAATGVTHEHCIDLTLAFKQDATKLRYDDWDDLIDYCRHSAAPVGRYLIDLHSESRAAFPASDALCNALQVLNHLQDCQNDYQALNRVYLPRNWMQEAGVEVEALRQPTSSPALRRVLERCLNGTTDLLLAARGLPGLLRNTRFAMEAAVILGIARALAAELRRRDPLAERVALSKAQVMACFAYGVRSIISRRRTPRRAKEGPAQSARAEEP